MRTQLRISPTWCVALSLTIAACGKRDAKNETSAATTPADSAAAERDSLRALVRALDSQVEALNARVAALETAADSARLERSPDVRKGRVPPLPAGSPLAARLGSRIRAGDALAAGTHTTYEQVEQWEDATVAVLKLVDATQPGGSHCAFWLRKIGHPQTPDDSIVLRPGRYISMLRDSLKQLRADREFGCPI